MRLCSSPREASEWEGEWDGEWGGEESNGWEGEVKWQGCPACYIIKLWIYLRLQSPNNNNEGIKLNDVMKQVMFGVGEIRVRDPYNRGGPDAGSTPGTPRGRGKDAE